MRTRVQGQQSSQRALICVITAVVVGACHDSPTGPAPSTVRLAVVSGNAQSAPVNTRLPQAVRV
jgi:hypothetical protein